MAARLARRLGVRAFKGDPFCKKILDDFRESFVEEIVLDQAESASGYRPVTPPPSSLGGYAGTFAGTWTAMRLPKIYKRPPLGITSNALKATEYAISKCLAPFYGPYQANYAFRQMGVAPAYSPQLVSAYYGQRMDEVPPEIIRQLDAHSRSTSNH